MDYIADILGKENTDFPFKKIIILFGIIVLVFLVSYIGHTGIFKRKLK
jgi:hypothetical protein